MLSSLQRRLLVEAYILQDKITASRFVQYFSVRYDVPMSTVWCNLRELRDLGLLGYGEGNGIKISEAGKMVINAIPNVEYNQYMNSCIPILKKLEGLKVPANIKHN
jgi:predicted transcriptional regulator